MYPFILELESEREHTYILTYAESMSEAVAKIELSTYIPDIKNIKIISAGDYNQLFEIPEHIAKILAIGNGVYQNGLNKIKDSSICNSLNNDAELVKEGII